MGKGRLEAFSDGVIAVIITIMVLEMKAPHGADLHALAPVLPPFLSYLLSFVFVGIYWNNHHHMLHTVKHVGGAIMWANLHLLFWLSLIPFVTAWMGENHFEPVPTAGYGFVMLMSALAYTLLASAIMASHGGEESELAKALGDDKKGKISLVAYAAAIGASFVQPVIACSIYVGVALIWLVPDPRIQKRVHE